MSATGFIPSRRSMDTNHLCFHLKKGRSAFHLYRPLCCTTSGPVSSPETVNLGHHSTTVGPPTGRISQKSSRNLKVGWIWIPLKSQNIQSRWGTEAESKVQSQTEEVEKPEILNQTYKAEKETAGSGWVDGHNGKNGNPNQSKKRGYYKKSTTKLHKTIW